MLFKQTGKLSCEFLLSKFLAKHSPGLSFCGEMQHFQVCSYSYLPFLRNSGDRQIDTQADVHTHAKTEK